MSGERKKSIRYIERRDRLNNLIVAGRKLRPNLPGLKFKSDA
jgi:hypothetical protein